MFRVHLSIISKGVDQNSNLQISYKCSPFSFLSRSAAVATSVWYSIIVTYVHVRMFNNMHRLFIRYTWVFHDNRKFGDKNGSSILFLACLGRTKRLVLPPTFVQEGYNIGSCTRHFKTSAAWRCKHCLRINLLRNLKNACSL